MMDVKLTLDCSAEIHARLKQLGEQWELIEPTIKEGNEGRLYFSFSFSGTIQQWRDLTNAIAAVYAEFQSNPPVAS